MLLQLAVYSHMHPHYHPINRELLPPALSAYDLTTDSASLLFVENITGDSRHAHHALAVRDLFFRGVLRDLHVEHAACGRSGVDSFCQRRRSHHSLYRLGKFLLELSLSVSALAIVYVTILARLRGSALG